MKLFAPLSIVLPFALGRSIRLSDERTNGPNVYSPVLLLDSSLVPACRSPPSHFKDHAILFTRKLQQGKKNFSGDYSEPISR